MPLPLALAIPFVSGGISAAEIIGSLGVLSAVGLKAYLGYEYLNENTSLFGSAPSGLNPIPVKFGTKPVSKTTTTPTAPVVPATPVAPSMSKTLSPTLDDYLRSLNRQKANTQSLATTLTTAGTVVKERNDALTQTAGASKFLVNQVEAKASLDEVSFALNAQSVVYAMIYETLDRNLSLISASLVASAQTAKVATDQAKTNASALVTISDRLEPFEDNQIHHRTIASPIPMDSVSARTSASPRELAHARDFAFSRGEADTNSIGATTFEQVEELFSDMDLTPDMFKNYIRFDTILNQVAADVDGDINAWEQLMEDFFK